MIKAVLVEDEKNAREVLEWQLRTYCPTVYIAAICATADEGIAAIKAHNPQIIFLDIEMPHKNGFEVLQAFSDPSFDVIFTTAYNQFALKAFRFAALDYLLKPIDAEDLVASVKRFQKRINHNSIQQQLELLVQQFKQPVAVPEKVPFATSDAIHFINPKSIIYCESNSNYTTLYFTDKSKLVVTKTLKEIEELLACYGFCRIHHSYIINLMEVRRYLKPDGGSIEMTNGAHLPISRQRKEEVIQVLTHYRK